MRNDLLYSYLNKFFKQFISQISQIMCVWHINWVVISPWENYHNQSKKSQNYLTQLVKKIVNYVFKNYFYTNGQHTLFKHTK